MKQLLLLVFITISLQVGAQKIRFTDPSNVWTVLHFKFNLTAPGTPRFYSSTVETVRYLTDTTVGGVSYRQLSNPVNYKRRLLVREDTIQQKIYSRYVDTTNSADTIEALLFDYNITTGDTIRTGIKDDWVHLVASMDKIMIGQDSYRVWHMIYVKFFPEPDYDYTFVEGIGAVRSPTFSIDRRYSGFKWDINQLRCFSTRNFRPSVTPALPLPQLLGYMVQGYGPVPDFDNNTSCSFAKVGINGVGSPREPIVYPNPGHKNIVLKLPACCPEGSLRISDMTGRIIYERSFITMEQLPIGQYLSIPGVYFYTLQDAATGQRYTGRFIFR